MAETRSLLNKHFHAEENRFSALLFSEFDEQPEMGVKSMIDIITCIMTSIHHLGTAASYKSP